MDFVDTHVHVACADVERFPRRPTGVGSSWWSEPDGEASAVLGLVRTAGASSVVVVQAVGAYGFDSSCAATAVAGSNGFARLVAAIDMTAEDPVASVEPCAGWRMFGVADGAPWLADGRAAAVFDAAATLGTVIVPTLFAEHLPALAALASRHPDVRIALDHCGFPDMAGDEGERRLFELVDVPSVRLKVSSHVLAAWQEQRRLDSTFPRLVEAFGTARMCWGSDHPQHRGLSYDDKLALARHATRHLDEGQRRQFFTGTAAELGWASA